MNEARTAVHRWMIYAALVVGGALLPLAVRAAPPTTYAECYTSAHTCERERCKRLDGHDQVTCMQQCSREYESCASHAATGQPASGTAAPAGKERHHRRGTTDENQ